MKKTGHFSTDSAKKITSTTKISKKRLKISEKNAKQLVKPADDAFSKSVRLRDSELREGSYWGTCITCSRTGKVAWHDGKKLRFTSGWDAGHFIGRASKIVRYDDRNVNLQCSFRCNRMRSGEYEKYRVALDYKYGAGIAEELENIARTTTYFKMTKEYLLCIIHDSKEQTKFYGNNLTNTKS